MTHERFVELLTKTYNLPKMRRRADTWWYSNEDEGWQIILSYTRRRNT